MFNLPFLRGLRKSKLQREQMYIGPRPLGSRAGMSIRACRPQGRAKRSSSGRMALGLGGGGGAGPALTLHHLHHHGHDVLVTGISAL